MGQTANGLRSRTSQPGCRAAAAIRWWWHAWSNGGAALGAIGGAIAGNAGEGAAIGAAAGGGLGMMRQRRAERGYQEEVQEASAKNQQTRATFDRAHNVCMEAKGYKIG